MPPPSASVPPSPGPADPPPLTELLLLHRLGGRRRILALLGAATAAVVAGAVIVTLQAHLADERAGGRPLGLVGSLLAEGSSPLTAWPGWVAAASFLVAALRAGGDDREPPAGHVRSGDAWSVTELRASLRGEYRTARLALCLLVFLAAVDLLRVAGLLALRLSGSAAGAQLPAAAVEASGLVAAALALGLWCRRHGARLDRWGAA